MAYNNPIPTLSSNDSAKKTQSNRETLIEGYSFYESVYFAFMDVLGFKQAFDENRQDPKKEFAKAYQDVFKYYSQLLSKANVTNSGFSKAGQTSDSLYFYTDRVDFLAEFIKIYLHFSLYAMSKNVFFRGGIANGCLFVNEPHQFYGDCVIKAYLLEEKIAKYPRVALDKTSFLDLQEIPDVKEMITRNDKDGRFYLNPFVRIEKSELVSITNLDATHIQSFKKKTIQRNIDNGKARFEFDENNYLKYQFLFDSISSIKGDFE